MSVECPKESCNFTSEVGYGIVMHWNPRDDHEGELKDHHPDFDTSRKEESCEAISEGMKGVNPWEDKEHPCKGVPKDEEHKRKISETLEGHNYLDREHFDNLAQINEGNDYASGYERTEAQKRGLKKGRNMERPDEWCNNISDALKGNRNGSRCVRYVEELGYQVDSSWEVDIGFLLKSLGMEHEREPEFEIWDERSYFPDFQVGDIIIEVKGWADEYSEEKAEYFTETYDDHTYVVVGDKMECDIHIPWEDREQLIQVVCLHNTVNQ